MTNARIRTCPTCQAPFFKTEGCNMMTCRCGTKSCYLCRTKIPADVGYKHFCQHVHTPGVGCQARCNACLLFTNSAQDDERLVEEERARAAQELKEKAARGEAVVNADVILAKVPDAKLGERQAIPAQPWQQNPNPAAMLNILAPLRDDLLALRNELAARARPGGVPAGPGRGAAPVPPYAVQRQMAARAGRRERQRPAGP